jgi:hypothetical protein
LSTDRIGVFILDLGAEEDDAVLKEGLIDIVIEPEAVAPTGVVGIRT